MNHVEVVIKISVNQQHSNQITQKHTIKQLKMKPLAKGNSSFRNNDLLDYAFVRSQKHYQLSFIITFLCFMLKTWTELKTPFPITESNQ